MTEITDQTNSRSSSTSEKMPESVERFILQWGDMGSHWGLNRSIAQIHALLYLAEQPLSADDIAAQLDVARSNVSTSLRELLSWRLIRRVPLRRERRDHYVAETDVWEIAALIAAGRKAREIDPAREALVKCVDTASNDPNLSAHALERLVAMRDFVDTMDHWYEQILSIDKRLLVRLVGLGDKVVGLMDRVKPNSKSSARS